jgi:hypothetical protein
MSIAFYARAATELRRPRIKQCVRHVKPGTFAPMSGSQLLVACSRQPMVAEEVPVAPSA